MPRTAGNSESIIPGKPYRIISKEGLAYAGMCAHGLFWDEMTCQQISHLSPRGLHSFPGFESQGGNFLARRPRFKKVHFERKKALSNNFYLAPGPGYGVFVRAHVGYQTCINFFARFRADLKITSQRPVGLRARKKLSYISITYK